MNKQEKLNKIRKEIEAEVKRGNNKLHLWATLVTNYFKVLDKNGNWNRRKQKVIYKLFDFDFQEMSRI